MNRVNRVFSWFAIGIAVVSLLISLSTLNGNADGNNSSDALEGVLSSGVLRVGYVVYPPHLFKDPQTGELSGIYYDLLNEIGEQLDLTVEWVEEAGYGTIATSLAAGRYDVYPGIWPNAARSKAISFSMPAYYDSLYVYARADDTRFDDDLEAINSPAIKISTMDGEIGDFIAMDSFPQAQRINLPQTSAFNQVILQVVSNKADIVFLPPSNADLFLEANPGTIRRVSETPVRVYGSTLGVKLGETELQEMLNVAIRESINTGAMDRILNQYDPTALRVAPPYTH